MSTVPAPNQIPDHIQVTGSITTSGSTVNGTGSFTASGPAIWNVGMTDIVLAAKQSVTISNIASGGTATVEVYPRAVNTTNLDDIVLAKNNGHFPTNAQTFTASAAGGATALTTQQNMTGANQGRNILYYIPQVSVDIEIGANATAAFTAACEYTMAVHG